MQVENTHFCDPLYANKYVDDAPFEVSPSSSSASSTTLTFLMCLECFCCGTFDFCWAHVVFTFLRFCKYLKKKKYKKLAESSWFRQGSVLVVSAWLLSMLLATDFPSLIASLWVYLSVCLSLSLSLFLFLSDSLLSVATHPANLGARRWSHNEIMKCELEQNGCFCWCCCCFC